MKIGVRVDARCWIAGLLPMVLLVAGAAELAQRYQPMATIVALLMLMSLASILLLSSSDLSSRHCRNVAMVLLALWLWLGLSNAVNIDERIVGWWQWGERAAQLIVLLVVAGSRLEPAAAMRLLGYGASIAVMAALMANLICGYASPGDTRCWGFGHINILVNTAGPSLLAWTVYLLSGNGRNRRDWVVAILGAACLAAVSLLTQRRGVPVAWAVGIGVIGWRWWSLRSPRMAWAFVIVMGIILLSVTVAFFVDTSAVGTRMQRLLIYRAGIETASASPWIGHGQFGALSILEGSGEAARHCRASGWGTHVHSEPLELLLDGGVIGLALGLFAAFLVWRHAWKIQGASSWAIVAGLSASIAHACTDNVYGTEIGGFALAIWVGVILLHPATPMESNPSPSEKGIRWMGWLLAIPCACCIISALPSATAHREAMPSVHLRALRSSVHPLDLVSHVNRLGEMATEADDIDLVRQAVSKAAKRVGWVPDFAWLELRFAIRAGDRDEMSSAAARMLRLDPFQLEAYRCLDDRDMDAVWGNRRRILDGLGVQAPLEQEPIFIDQAADTFAAIAVARHRPELREHVHKALPRLLARYGDVSFVALFAIETALQVPGSQAWVAGCREYLTPLISHERVTSAMAQAVTPAEARHMVEVINVVIGSQSIPKVLVVPMERLKALMATAAP